MRLRRAPAVLTVLTLTLACVQASGPAPEPEPEEQKLAGELVESALRAEARGDFDTAIAAYREALERTPWNSRLERALASAHANRALIVRREGGAGALERAESDLRAALALQPDDEALRRNLAVVLRERADRSLDPDQATELRAAARELAPEVVAAPPAPRRDIERRLDLAFELIERGQLDAGIERLERLAEQHPRHTEVWRLLGEAYTRRGSLLDERGDHAGAAREFGRAVAALEQAGSCPTGCSEESLRRAHHNRIVALWNGGQRAEARDALDAAERSGLRFPELRRVLGTGGGTP